MVAGIWVWAVLSRHARCQVCSPTSAACRSRLCTSCSWWLLYLCSTPWLVTQHVPHKPRAPVRSHSARVCATCSTRLQATQKLHACYIIPGISLIKSQDGSAQHCLCLHPPLLAQHQCCCHSSSILSRLVTTLLAASAFDVAPASVCSLIALSVHRSKE